jgi:hypothetical protein
MVPCRDRAWWGPITGHCTVPKKKALFFPMQNIHWVQDDSSDPPFGDGSDALEILEWALDTYGGGSVVIDGMELDTYRVYSEPFLFRELPSEEYPLGLVSTQALAAGDYLMLEPLKKGQHTIHITGWADWPSGGLDVTYDLTVD